MRSRNSADARNFLRGRSRLLGMRNRARGYALVAVLSTMVILLVAFAALKHYEVVGRRAYTRAEADLQLLQARRWDLAEKSGVLPRGARRPRLEVTAQTEIEAKGVEVPEHFANATFVHTPSYRWTGYPNLLIERSNNVVNPPPPRAVEYRVTPHSWSGALSVFQGQKLREVVAQLPPCAACAPHGSIRLSKVVGWANPPLGEDSKARECYSGEPVAVAAQKVDIDEFPYGVAYAGGPGSQGDSDVAIKAGLAIAHTTGNPFKPFVDELVGQIDHSGSGSDGLGLLQQLVATARQLDDKTAQLESTQPGIVDTLEELAQGHLSVLSRYVSIHPALNFKCVTIPHVEKFDLWPPHWTFYLGAPHPPDHDIGDMAEKRRKVEAARAEMAGLFKKKSSYLIRITAFAGKQSKLASQLELKPPPDLELKLSPPEKGLIHQLYNPELKECLYTKLHAAELAAHAIAGGGNSTLPVRVEGSTDLLKWLAQYGGKGGYGDPAGPPDAVDIKVLPAAELPQGTPPNGPWEPDVIGAVLFNRLLAHLELRYPSKPEEMGQPPQAYLYFKYADQWTPVGDTDGPWGESTWRTLMNDLEVIDKMKVAPEYKNAAYAQEQLLKHINKMSGSGSVSVTESPYAKAGSILAALKVKDAQLDAVIAQKNHELEAIEKEFAEAVKKQMPTSRAAQKKLEDDVTNPSHTDFKDLKGLRGSAYATYGENWEFLIKLITKAIDHHLPEIWEPEWPLIFYGDAEWTLDKLRINPRGGAPTIQPGLNVTATFTVPSGRTFYYDNDLRIEGDLLMQRGSTLVCNNLTVAAPPVAANSTYFFGEPSGRILLEEGASVIVRGNLRTAGNRWRGSVVCLCPAGAIHPISSAVLCQGQAYLPYGVVCGEHIGEALSTLGSAGEAFNAAMTFWISHFSPNMAKIPDNDKLPSCSPFHPRKTFFAQQAPRYDIRVYVLWFIPYMVTVIHLPTVPNEWPDYYNKLSNVYAEFANLNLGENLYTQGDLWLKVFKSTYLGQVPKLDIKKIAPPLPALTLPRPVDWEDFCQKVLVPLLLEKSSVAGANPARSEGMLGDIKDWIEALKKFAIYFNDLENAIGQWMDKWVGQLPDALSHEQGGALIYAASIQIGLDEKGVPLVTDKMPYMASGLFVASGDIDIHCLSTVGLIFSKNGSINSKTGVTTQLLAYHRFAEASIHMPNPNSKWNETFTIPKVDLPTWAKRSLDPFYGEARTTILKEAPGQGLDVRVSPRARVTVEGWDQ